MEHALIAFGLPIVVVVGLLLFAVKKMKRSPDIKLVQIRGRRHGFLP
jgi:hypothetical protein